MYFFSPCRLQAARLCSNLPDVPAFIELKRIEHERQKQLHCKNFEEQTRMLEAKHALEERLLHTANVANDACIALRRLGPDAATPRARPAQPLLASKRKSGTYAPSLIQDAAPAYGSSLHPHSFARAVGAKSMPASRRTSASSQELERELSDLTL
ncbi:hypothetical protein AURDEDRAFT_157907 [Auricularia subglabra TFB-10046 SS5]|nr:hypothetical protein AURDEDRAFT_157907 [Auricularia subglabra TFB-10046 SS5]